MDVRSSHRRTHYMSEMPVGMVRYVSYQFALQNDPKLYEPLSLDTVTCQISATAVGLADVRD